MEWLAVTLTGVAPLQVNWPSRGKRQISSLYGYYFELDWGLRHQRLPSLQYTQLYDPPNVLADLDSKGWVSVKASGATDECVFEFDFTRSAIPRRARPLRS